MAAALAAVPVYASAEDAERVNEMISELPETEDITDEDAEAVEEAMNAYNSLSTADKLGVEGYEKLSDDYEELTGSGILIDDNEEEKENEETQRQIQDSLQESDSNETQVTKYVFSISRSESTASIVIRYTTDTDGDGYGDMPERIVLTDPDGISTAIVKSSASMKDETMDIAISWEQRFVQLDIASAAEGKWTITTSEPVTVTRMPYAGIRQEIKPENASSGGTDAGAPEEAEEAAETPKNPNGAANTFISFLPLIILVAVVLFVLKKWNVIGNGSPSKGKGKKGSADTSEDNNPLDDIKTMSDEELTALMKKEYEEERARVKAEEQEEDMEPLDDDPVKKTGEITQDDIDNDDSVEEYEEGNTGLLDVTNSPFTEDKNANVDDKKRKDVDADTGRDNGDGDDSEDTDGGVSHGGFGDFGDF